MPREVWLLIDQLVVGGAQRQLVTLAVGLHRRGHRVRVDALAVGGRFADQIRSAGIELHQLDRSRSTPARYLRDYAAAARQRRPDVIHSFLPGQNIALAVMKPILGTSRLVWGVRVGVLELDHYTFKGRTVYRFEPLLARVPDLTIVNSSSGARRLLERGHPRGSLAVVPNGVDTTMFRPDVERRRRQRQAWGIADHELLVGTVGRLDPAKDHETFLRAMSHLAGAGGNRFVIVGGGEAEPARRLEALARSLGLADRVRFAGEVRDMAAAYNAMDVYCLASKNEALPNALLEAMAVGVPCAATDVGDVAAVLEGIAEPVPIGGAVELAAACRRAAVEPGLGDRLRERVVERFQSDRLIDRTEALLEELCSDPRRRRLRPRPRG